MEFFHTPLLQTDHGNLKVFIAIVLSFIFKPFSIMPISFPPTSYIKQHQIIVVQKFFHPTFSFILLDLLQLSLLCHFSVSPTVFLTALFLNSFIFPCQIHNKEPVLLLEAFFTQNNLHISITFFYHSIIDHRKITMRLETERLKNKCVINHHILKLSANFGSIYFKFLIPALHKIFYISIYRVFNNQHAL